MLAIALIIFFTIAVIGYFVFLTDNTGVVEVDIVNQETGEVEQAEATVEPAVMVTDIKLRNKGRMLIREVQLIDMSDKPINIRDASTHSSKRVAGGGSPKRMVNTLTVHSMQLESPNSWAHIKLANPIPLGNLKKIVVLSGGSASAGTEISLYNGDNMLYSWTLQGTQRSYSFDI